MSVLPIDSKRPRSAFSGVWRLGIHSANSKQYSLMLLGCVAFVVASHLTSRGAVRLDSIEYWLLGMVPHVLFWTLFGRTQSTTELLYSLEEGWLYSLLGFVLLRASLQSESFEFPIYELTEYNLLLANEALSLVYVLFGFTTAMLRRNLFHKGRRFSIVLFTTYVLLTSQIFFALLFLIHLLP